MQLRAANERLFCSEDAPQMRRLRGQFLEFVDDKAERYAFHLHGLGLAVGNIGGQQIICAGTRAYLPGVSQSAREMEKLVPELVHKMTD